MSDHHTPRPQDSSLTEIDYQAAQRTLVGGGEGEKTDEQQPACDGSQVLKQLRRLPGGRELLELAADHDGRVGLVGGAVRDIVLGTRPRELDVTVESNVRQLACALAAQLAGEMTLHERFGTAMVRAETASIDLATMRAESYRMPGALPDVRPGSLEQDLRRRDFAVNAITVALNGQRPGEVHAIDGAFDDLAAGRLRVLHDASFREDPTRILRLARYAARLRFAIEPHTATLAAEALADGALKTVSGPRLGAELRLALSETDAVSVLATLEQMGVFAAWSAGASFDERVVRTALAILPEDGSRQTLLAASLLFDSGWQHDREKTEPAMRRFLADMELPAGEGESVLGVVMGAARAVDHLSRIERTADLLELARGVPVESLALAAAVCETKNGPKFHGRNLIERWLREQRHVALQVTGDDLIAAGIPEGPEIGMRLGESYRLLVEERIEPGRGSELRAALEARV